MVNKNNSYGLILIFGVILVVLQSSLIIYSFIKINDLVQTDSKYQIQLSLLNKTFSQEIQTNNLNFQNQLNDIKNNLISTKADLKKEVSSIQAKTTSDFSNIIETSKKSVVTIKTSVSQGTGFIISDDGYVVTNAHVLYGSSYANAITNNQETKKMTLIGYDSSMDIALLKINGSYDFLQFSDSDEVRVGEKVIAIGNPLGFSFSVSEGIVSAVNREGSNGLNAYIQTDASLNPGNSGGPLINTNGDVVGINNFKAAGESLGFALESNYIKETINQIARDRLNQTLIV